MGWICFIGLGYCRELLNVFCFCTNCKSLWLRASADRPNCHVFMSTVRPPLIIRHRTVFITVQQHDVLWVLWEIWVSFTFCLVFSNLILNFCRARHQSCSPAVQRGGHRDRDSQVWDRDFRGGPSRHLETEGRHAPPVCCKIKHWSHQ